MNKFTNKGYTPKLGKACHHTPGNGTGKDADKLPAKQGTAILTDVRQSVTPRKEK